MSDYVTNQDFGRRPTRPSLVISLYLTLWLVISYDFFAVGLGMAKVHAPPNTMVFPNV
jgi:hypothetical protein